jgi:subtilisin family serine protease
VTSSPRFLLIAHGLASCFQAQEAGITVVTASGNSAENQCVDKIGGQDGIINVGATDSDDAQNSLSNFGPCVDCVYRP